MKRFLHLLVVALLLAGLPLRGYSAALMAAGVHGAMQAQQPHAMAAHEGHDMSMHQMHEHGGHEMGEGAHHEMPHDASHGASNDTSQDHGANTCSYCGDCCSAGALQSLPVTLSALAPSQRAVLPASPSPASFLADLPVPPPNLLAA